MTSIREDIIANLKSTLQGISPTAGYNYDIAGVYRWRMPPTSMLVFPAILVADIGEVVQQINYPIHERALTISVEGWLKTEYLDDDDVGLAATKLITDIEVALMEDITRGSCAVDTILQSNQAQIGTPDNPYLVVEVVAEIKYRTLLTDPETAK